MLSDELVGSWIEPLTTAERSLVDALEKKDSLSSLTIEDVVRAEVISAAIIALDSRGFRVADLSNLVVRGSFRIPVTQHPIELILKGCKIDFVDASGSNFVKFSIENSKIGSVTMRRTVIIGGVYLKNVEAEVIRLSDLTTQHIEFSDVYSSVIFLKHLQDIDSISFGRALQGNLHLEQSEVRELSFNQVEFKSDNSGVPRISLSGVTAHEVAFFLCKNLGWLHCSFLKSQVLSIRSVEFTTRDWTGGGVDLEDCIIDQELRLGNSPMGYLKLKRVSTNKIVDDEASWVPKGNLILQNVSWQESIVEYQIGKETYFRRKWLRLQPDWYSEGYEQLAAEVSRNGHNREARSLRIEAEQRLREWGKNELGKTWSRLLRFTTGYGYQTSRIIPLAFGMWIFGAIAASIGHSWGVIIPTGDDKIDFSSIGYSLDTLVPIVKLGIAEHWTQSGKGVTGTVIRVYFWFHVIAGWIIGGLAAAGLSGFLHRDR